MKINRWYVVAEQDDGTTKQLYSADLPSNVVNFLEQYMGEVEQCITELERGKQREAIK
jgi:hypothetical protein